MSITIEIPPSIENILNKRAHEQHLDRESILKQMYERVPNIIL
ncbi:hypothetical protein SAMN04488589_0068 [Methanolobus vulcani]|jgi:hypothetical protein|uniref:Uncharacterized protein n=1 Tax=Methanolobus vulcani TaxID=38026 RepID=A0A7Z7FBK0_9EURY|nr:hypothetical protein [Methanolobus vulcani]SDF23436.1 hypothetical protein SAMN04488589_0068 [Methanolobus vulcani]